MEISAISEDLRAIGESLFGGDKRKTYSDYSSKMKPSFYNLPFEIKVLIITECMFFGDMSDYMLGLSHIQWKVIYDYCLTSNVHKGLQRWGEMPDWLVLD